MANSQRYSDWLKDCEILRVRFLHQTAASQLGFSERLIYSVLVWRGERKTTKAWLARFTGMCRSKTIPPAIRKLEQHGLIHYESGSFNANEPSGNTAKWFVPSRVETAKWQQRLAYVWVGIPAPKSEISLRQSYVMSVKFSLQENGRSCGVKVLVRLTGLSRQAVSRTLSVFKSKTFMPNWFRIRDERQEAGPVDENQKATDRLYKEMGMPRCFENVTNNQRHKLLLPLVRMSGEVVVFFSIEEAMNKWSRQIGSSTIKHKFLWLQARIKQALPHWEDVYLIEKRAGTGNIANSVSGELQPTDRSGE